MKKYRKNLILILTVIMFFSCLTPAVYADELEDEELQIEQALSEENEEDVLPEPEPVLAEEDEETEEAVPETEEATAPSEEPEAETVVLEWQEPGNTSLNILYGGTMLESGDCFYTASDAIYCECGDEKWVVAYDEAKNLNLCGDMLYYSCDGVGIKRVSVSSFDTELVYSCTNIEQLYVCGSVFYYLSDGCVYRWTMYAEQAEKLSAPEQVVGFIPTEYGMLYLTGDVLDRTVWVENTAAVENVESCYVDGEYLVVTRLGTWQCSLSALFAGDYTLHDYSLHEDEIENVDLPLEEQLELEAAFFETDLYIENSQLGVQEKQESEGLLQALFSVSLNASSNSVSLDGSSVYTTAQQQALANGNTNLYNITRRARQQAEVLWRPLAKRLAWGGGTYRTDRTVTSEDGVTTNYFKANEVYQGIPYAQPYQNGGYVGWNLSISDFIKNVNNPNNVFYSKYSYSEQQGPYYGSDCSAFVSWAWNLDNRQTCSSLVYFSNKIGTNINQLQLGDCLNCTTAHVVLVTDIGYDSSGKIISVEITEQTPLIMKVTNYGVKLPNKTNPHIYYVSDLSKLQSNYLNNGYVIYRRNVVKNVSYTADSSIPLAEDGWLTVPTLAAKTNDDGTSILVTLSHRNGYPIHYTTDGSQATLKSPLYSEPIALSKSTMIRAIADYSDSDASGAFELVYTVPVEKAATPQLKLVSGAMDESDKTIVAANSFVTLQADDGAKVYYTTDGTEPNFSSKLMTSAGIKITEPITLKAFSIGESTLKSSVTYNMTIGTFHTIQASSTTGGKITPSGDVKVLDGGSPSFTFKADSGYKISDVIVDGNSIGAQSSYKFKNVKENHTIQVKFAIDLPFKDVKESSWYADSVAFAYTKGLFNGTTTTEFSPNAKMNRGMFVTVLGRFAGQKNTLEGFTKYLIGYSNGSAINIRSAASTSSSVVGSIPSAGKFVTVCGSGKDSAGDTWYKIIYDGTTGYVKKSYNGKDLILAYDGGFTDVAGQYFYGYTQWAYMNGLVNGTSSTKFSPNAAISRQDICVIMYNYLTKYLGMSISSGSKTFSDDSSIGSYAKTAVHAMSNIGIVNGYTDGSFGPKKSATRAEVATMFMRLYAYLNN